MSIAPERPRLIGPASHAGAASEAIDDSGILPVSADAKASMRICVVDDDHTLRQRLVHVLRLEGYAAIVGGPGLEALAMLKRRAFDIVLADLFISNLDAFELLQAALETNPETLVIMMSPYVTPASSVGVLRQGAWEYLLKPVSAAGLKLIFTRATSAVCLRQQVLTSSARPEARSPQARLEDPVSAEDQPRQRLPLRPTAESSVASAGSPGAFRHYRPARAEVIGRFESQYLAELINRSRGNLSAAARMANMDRTTLYRLMSRHGLRPGQRPDVKSEPGRGARTPPGCPSWQLDS
jgi:DNA-binding NtrC family response regulator